MSMHRHILPVAMVLPCTLSCVTGELGQHEPDSRVRGFDGGTSGITHEATGTIRANPNPVVVAEGATSGTVSLTWSTAYTDHAQVWVSVNGGTSRLVASSKASTQALPWIQLDRVYRFDLHAASHWSSSGRGKLLASVDVTATPEAVSEPEPEPEPEPTCTDAVCPTGVLDASPDPVVIPSGESYGAVTLTWSSIDTPCAQVWVSRDHGPETLVASNPSGSRTLSWIHIDSTYRFTLYAASSWGASTRGALLTAVDVTPRREAPEPGPTCDTLTCPEGASCALGCRGEDCTEYCDAGTTVFIPYDLQALRVDPSLDLHPVFTGTGTAPVELPVLAPHPSLRLVEVASRGAGFYEVRQEDRDPWWATKPLVLSRSVTVDEVRAEGADTSIRGQGYQDMGTGLWPAAITLSTRTAQVQAYRDAGKPLLGYLEGTGDIYVFLAAFASPFSPARGTDVVRYRYSHWNWGSWGGGALPAGMDWMWMGPHHYIDAPPIAEPYTLNHPVYGMAPPTLFGERIVSPPSAAWDPRDHELYRRCSTRDINGELSVEWTYRAASDDLSLPGVLSHGGAGYSLVSLHRDLACPLWRDLHDRSLAYAIDHGTEGSWMDNVSLFDSWRTRPNLATFGAHSVAGFPAWLREHASPAFLARSGLGEHLDAGTLDITCLLKETARTRFGERAASSESCATPIDPLDTVFHDERWDFDPAWRAYQAYQAWLAVDYYRHMRRTLDRLDPDFLWGTNDLPSFGAIVGAAVAPSMNMAELATGTHFSTGMVEVGLPPQATLASFYDTASQFDLAQFQSVFFYLDQVPYQDSASLHRALAAEALSFDTFLMTSATDPRAPGTVASAAELNAWLKPHAADLEGRHAWGEVGILYSPDSWFIPFRPRGPDPKLRFAHVNEFAGWHRELRRLRHQPQPLIADRLTPRALEAYDVLLLPDVEVLPEPLVDEVIAPWVRAGGVLIATARTGRYRGREALFEPYDGVGHTARGLRPLTGIADPMALSSVRDIAVGSGKIVLVPGLVGIDAWLKDDVAGIEEVVRRLRTSGILRQRVEVPSAPESLRVRLHTDASRGRLFVDFVNRAWDPSSDTLPAAEACEATILLPTWMRAANLTVRTAAGRGAAQLTPVGETKVKIRLAAVPDIITAIVEIQ